MQPRLTLAANLRRKASRALVNNFHQSGFAVICSQALNSLGSQRFRARLARNRLAIVASLPLAARRPGAPGFIVLLDDSAIGSVGLGVIAPPSRTRPAHNTSGGIASIP
jgi:hypothetical protein